MEKNTCALVNADENGTVLAVSGNMNSENSAKMESGLLALRAAHPAGSLAIDASVLDGISSAGVSVFKRMIKNESSMSVRNAKPEIYKALREHGLTELIKIEKSAI